MPLFSNPKVWAGGNTLTAAALNLLGTALETFLNVTKLSSVNIQNGGVTNANLACPSYTETLTLQVNEGGTGTTRILADFQGYSTTLDSLVMEGDGQFIWVTACGASGFFGAGEKVKLYLKPAATGVDAPVANSEVDVNPSSGFAPDVATLTATFAAGDILSVRMTAAGSLAATPVMVRVTIKRQLRA
jgi:hypothetical protein